MQKLPSSESRSRAHRPRGRKHTDGMRPIKTTFYPCENRCIIVFIDYYSRYAKAYVIELKSEIGDVLEKYISHIRNIIGKNPKVCYIRDDNAREYTSGTFAEVMKSEKIEQDFSPSYTPELSGTSERFNESIQWKSRALLSDSGLP